MKERLKEAAILILFFIAANAGTELLRELL
jgi:hypothetical protein